MRASEAVCPFCGGLDFVPPPALVAVGRFSRGAMATLASAGVAMLAEACASHRNVYGTPPSEIDPVRFMLETTDIARARAIVRKHAAAAPGCRYLREHEDLTVARCSSGLLGVSQAPDGRVAVDCTGVYPEECRAQWTTMALEACAAGDVPSRPPHEPTPDAGSPAPETN